MLVRCPDCRFEFRVIGFEPDVRVVRYLCGGCNSIVRLDLELDEVPTSSSAGSYRVLERRKTVLVADDAKAVLDLAEGLLDEAGFNVLRACDGESALRMIREEHPDLVLLDLSIQGPSGLDVLSEVRRDERVGTTPVMVMSGAYEETVLATLRGRAQGYMSKDRIRDTLVFRAR